MESAISKEEIIRREKLNLDYYNEIFEKYNDDPEAYIANSGNPKHIEFIETKLSDMILKWTDEDWYKKGIEYYDEEDINEDGSVQSTYNQNSQWDWYQIGGRWSDSLKIKPHTYSKTRGERSWAIEDSPKRGYADSAVKEDIDWEHESMKDFETFAFLDSMGEWHEEGSMGMFGASTTTDNSWSDTFKKLLDNVNDDERLTVVDCHI